MAYCDEMKHIYSTYIDVAYGLTLTDFPVSNILLMVFGELLEVTFPPGPGQTRNVQNRE